MHPPTRIAPLDGLRGLAVLSVMVMHYYVTAPVLDTATAHHFFQRVFGFTFMGVDLFFVLSGFLIGGILLDHRDSPNLLRTFYTRRFFRIVPAYALLLLSFIVARTIPGLNTVNYGTYFSADVPFWSYAAFVQNIEMGLRRLLGPYWLGPTWSLAVEEQFYLLVPLLVQRLTARQLATGCAIVLVVSPLLRLVALLYADNNLAAVFLLPTRADGLVSGILCALAVRHAAVRAWLLPRPRLLIGVMAVGLAILGFMTLQGYDASSVPVCGYGYSLANVVFSAALLHVILFPVHRVAGVLNTPWICGAGMISYFAYLFHTPVWYVLHWLLLGRPPLHWSGAAWATTGLAFLMTLALGWLSWRCFEGPLQRFGRRFAYAPASPSRSAAIP